MSLQDDFNIEITENEESELSEKEYSDILGLEGMAGGGEAALSEELDEEKEEPVYVIPVEEIKQKSKSTYRRYDNDEEKNELVEEVPEPHKIPMDQIVSWKNSSISEQEAYSDEKYVSNEYWHYLQTNVSDYARSVQLENEKLYKDVEVVGISSIYAHFESLGEISRTETVSYRESIQITIPEQYTSPNKSFRQEEMVEVFSYAKKEENKGTTVSTFTQIRDANSKDVAQGQTENTTRDVNVAGQSHAEGQKDTAAEQGKIDIEASMQGHELKEETAREFRTSVNIDNKVQNVYEQSKTAIRSLTEDELVSEGHRETEKYIKPVSLAVAMFVSSSAIRNIKSELHKSVKAVQETATLVEQGKVSLSYLSGKKKNLKEKLNIMELSKESIHRIIHSRKDTYDFLVTRASLMDLDMSKQILEQKQREFLNSGNFFDMRKKETYELVALYFKHSKNEVLQKTNVMNLSLKDLKKLERSAKKNGLTAKDISAIRLARKMGNIKRARIAHGITKSKAFIRAWYDLSRNMKDEMLDEGFQTLSVSQKVGFATYSVVKVGVSAGKVSIHLVNKIPVVRYLESKVIAGAKYVGRETVHGIKAVGSKVTTPVKTATKTIKKNISRKIEEKVPKKTIAEIRKARAKATEKGKKAIAKAKKVANGMKKGVKATGNIVRVTTTPLRLLGTGLNSVISFLNTVRIKIAIGFLAMAGAFILLVAIMCMLISISSSSGESIATTILSKDTGLVASMVNILQCNIDEREAEAVALTDTVKNPEVLGGRTIERYGYQKADGSWTDGYTITHVDKNGVQIASGANNSKDVIILTYLLMQADFDSYTNARDKLLLDMWDLMNPDCMYEETDIYTCTTGCETIYYCCNDSVTLNATGHTYETNAVMQEYKDEGVFFKESIVSNTYGDWYSSVCNGHDHGSTNTSVVVPTGCTSYTISRTGNAYTVACNGHSTGASRHSSTSGTIAVPTGCDSYSISLSGTTYTATCSKTGGATHNHGSKNGTGAAEAPSTACDNYTYTYYCNGHSVDACFGHKDIEVTVTTIFMEQMFESNELPTRSTGTYYGSYWTRLSKFKSNPEAWDNGWTDNYIAWANSLYNQNWTNLYGIDPLGGISMCGRFTEEEIAVILAENGLTDRTNPQYRACYFALSKVGYSYSQELRDSGTAYDCSSLCYYAWAYAGKNITYEGSNTAAQEAKGLVNNGISVYDSTERGSVYNQGNLQSGDLIFYSYEDNDRYLDISHVAIYIGNGMVVEARGQAYGVVYREVPNISKIVLVCRVLY